MKRDMAWFGDDTGRSYKIEREVFDLCVTFDKKEAGKNWIDSLKEAKAWNELEATEDFDAQEQRSGRQIKVLAGDLFYFLKDMPDDKVLIMFPYGGQDDNELNAITDKSNLQKCKNITREMGKRFMKGLLDESEQELPTWIEFDKACDLATDAYQSECDSHWTDNVPPEAKKDKGPGAYRGPRASLDTSDSKPVYWNPVTKDFLIPVLDDAPGSMDDGVYVHVHANGETDFLDGPPTNDSLEQMTDDPKILAKIKAKKEATRNRFIKIDDPDNLS
jgi:hypothetical protein